MELVLPTTGELVNLEDEKQVAKVLREVQILKVRLAEADRMLREALSRHASVLGSKTFYVPDVGRVEVKNATETVYDAEEVEEGLRSYGMPEERISEIVVQTVSKRVKAAELQRAARANPDYALVMEAASEVREKIATVTIT